MGNKILNYGLLFVILIFSGCINAKRCAKYIQPVQADTVIKDSIVERIRDSTIYIDADTSVLNALLKCAGDKVKLVEILHYTQGKLAKLPIIHIKDNILYVKCTIDSLAIYFQWREKDVFRSLKTSHVYVKITNELTGWQWFQIWCGRILWMLAGLFIVWIVIKKYLPFLK